MGDRRERERMQRILGGQSGGDAGGTDGEVRSGVDNERKGFKTKK